MLRVARLLLVHPLAGLVSLALTFAYGAAAEAQRAAPVHVVLAVDGSAAMAREDRSLASHAAAKLIVDLLGPRDSLSVISFGAEASAPSTIPVAEHDRAWAAIDALPRTAPTADWGVGLEAAAALVAAPGSDANVRWLVVVITASASPSSRPASAIEAASQTLTTARAPSFAIGLGADLAASSAGAVRDAIHAAASRTGGSYLAADERDLLRTSLAVLGARVGFLVPSPVRVEPGMPRIAVRPGTRRLLVVALGVERAPLSLVRFPPARPRPRIVDAGPPNDASAVVRDVGPPSEPADAGAPPPGEAWPFGRASDVFRRDAHSEPGGAGYSVLAVGRPTLGDYELTVGSSGRPRPEVVVIVDVGIRLGLQGIGRFVVPEAPLRLSAMLRAANGAALDLPPDLRRELEVEIVAGPHRAANLLVDVTGSAEAVLPPLDPGQHVVEARLRHFRGLIQVQPASITTTSRSLSAIGLARRPGITFDEVAHEPMEVRAHLELAGASRIAEPLTFDARFANVPHASELELVPPVIELDPTSRWIDFVVRVKDPLRLRRSGREYVGQIQLVPRHPEKVAGTRIVVIPLRGRVREWSQDDWIAAYQWHAAGALAALVAAVAAIVVAVRVRRRRAPVG